MAKMIIVDDAGNVAYTGHINPRGKTSITGATLERGSGDDRVKLRIKFDSEWVPAPSKPADTNIYDAEIG